MDATLSNTTLSDMLRDARIAKGLELNDIAEITHVRKDYLQALEEGRYGDLPEDIYARNFLRLYAQTVGLDDAKTLERFSRERRAALGISTIPGVVENGYREATPRSRNPAAIWLPALILLGAIGGFGYFFFNRYSGTSATTSQPETVTAENNVPAPDTATLTDETLGTDETQSAGGAAATTTETPSVDASTGTTTQTPAETTSESTTPVVDTATTPDATSANAAANSATTATTTPTDSVSSVRFSLVTNPPGAEATLDNYPFPTRTPFFNAPVTPRSARVLRITLEGYQPYEELLDISADMSKAITLVPVGATEAAVLGETPVAGQATGQGQLGITVEAQTWLEVYQSTVRGEGERLVYTTVQPGQTFTFNLPVYVHVGNAAGARLTQNGQDAGLMGSSGEVTGRAFGQPLPPAPAPAATEPQPTEPEVEGPQ